MSSARDSSSSNFRLSTSLEALPNAAKAKAHNVQAIDRQVNQARVLNRRFNLLVVGVGSSPYKWISLRYTACEYSSIRLSEYGHHFGDNRTLGCNEGIPCNRQLCVAAHFRGSMPSDVV